MSLDKLTDAEVNAIADNLDSSFAVYFHKTTRLMLFVPDENNPNFMDFDGYEAELEAIEADPKGYWRFAPMPSRERYEVMSNFSRQVNHPVLRRELEAALRKPKPFRRFKDVLLSAADDYIRDWNDFEFKASCDYVRRAYADMQEAGEEEE